MTVPQAEAARRLADALPRSGLADGRQVKGAGGGARAGEASNRDSRDALPDLARRNLHEGGYLVATRLKRTRPALADRPRAPDHQRPARDARAGLEGLDLARLEPLRRVARIATRQPPGIVAPVEERLGQLREPPAGRGRAQPEIVVLRGGAIPVPAQPAQTGSAQLQSGWQVTPPSHRALTTSTSSPLPAARMMATRPVDSTWPTIRAAVTIKRSFYANRVTTRVSFCPPKPKLLLSAASTRAWRALLGT